ncbi:MAG: UDP-3-O-acyl-N-acetylglucosamine deacetylase [Proteobacteria bacterium]|jgi:UDP-3-O-[3-hydroxymyristoyl] N-acetylglucosamine deacetylase|nr:UDP-3-O-acyl-N-acetylglucosamine deacetylase [Pseudomonadota bacterium]
MMNWETTKAPQFEKTLRKSISFIGIGLHSGKKVTMVIKPAMPGTGILFLRKDVLAGQGMISARWYNVTETRLSTTLGNEHGVTVATVEHLLAALRGCGIDNALIELDGPEIPIMDGSSAPFVTTIEQIGTVAQPQKRNVIWIQRPIEVRDNDKYAILMPYNSSRITIEIDFPDSPIQSQTLSVELINEAFRNDVARARTFGFSQQVNFLRKQGLARGGSLNNAVLVDGDRIVNEEGLRYTDEFVRHKILDCLGDLALAGVPIMGHLYAYKPGHALNNQLMHKLFDDRSNWSYLTMDEFMAVTGARATKTAGTGAEFEGEKFAQT